MRINKKIDPELKYHCIFGAAALGTFLGAFIINSKFSWALGTFLGVLFGFMLYFIIIKRIYLDKKMR